jgi:hypothetical protein
MHQLRRRPYNSLFSIQSITKLQDLIQGSAEALASHFDRNKGNGQFLDVSILFLAVWRTISDYAFGRNMGFWKNQLKGKNSSISIQACLSLGGWYGNSLAFSASFGNWTTYSSNRWSGCICSLSEGVFVTPLARFPTDKTYTL